ncbi:MAG TPA: hypothetical protein VNZ47_10060 [Candidatus Dormibacteraeota bacterium]|jgi:hypothetical protein|nr:hypothetical protein [Candidatus Dormibacteraeota bacterium]
MPRVILLVAGLTLFSSVFVQGQTAYPYTTIPANGAWGGPLLVTPIATFPNPTPTAGISDAGRAGISIENNGAGTSYSYSGMETTTAPASPATPVQDFGPSAFVVGPSDASAPSTIGVAEVAIRYKSEKGTRNARVLDNEDVHSMLNNKNGVTLAKNMPPLGRGAAEQGGQTQTAEAQAGAPPTASQPGHQNAQAGASASQPGQSGAAPSGQNQIGAASTQAENSTTPQINQNQQSNDAQGSRRLPATATFLPLLGLLGLISGGIGFWFRKFRN